MRKFILLPTVALLTAAAPANSAPPQVASQAHAHVRVTKLTDGKTTRTMLTVLGTDERVEEIARMLGGVSVTDKAREHAAEMLKVRMKPEPQRSQSRAKARPTGR